MSVVHMISDAAYRDLLAELDAWRRRAIEAEAKRNEYARRLDAIERAHDYSETLGASLLEAKERRG